MATVNGTNVNFVKVSTTNQYKDLVKTPGTIYFVESENKIYLDDKGYGMSGEDAARFLSVNGGQLNGSLIINDPDGIRFLFSDLDRYIRPSEDGFELQVNGSYYKFGEDLLLLQDAYGEPMKISGVADPDGNNEAANKAYVDQEIKTITDLKGANEGFAELDDGGKVPLSQLPSYVDDVVEYANKASFPASNEAEKGKLYIDLSNNNVWRWGGSAYVNVSDGNAHLVLGETQATAYRGDRGKTAYDHSQLKGTNDNPHNITKAKVGLSVVENYAVASQAEAEAGTSTGRYMTPLRTKQAIEELAPKLTWTVWEEE